jgi:LytS/YehU family sensor histidine kinase
MLLHRNKDLVLLNEEIAILENYLYVQKSRFADALHIQIDISATILSSKRIVPLALQLLVENALKHNVVSKSKPLHIIITATGDSITIRNSFNPKISKEKGAGLGLKNIQKRYTLLTDKKMYYGVSEKEFIVNLPLL